MINIVGKTSSQWISDRAVDKFDVLPKLLSPPPQKFTSGCFTCTLRTFYVLCYQRPPFCTIKFIIFKTSRGKGFLSWGQKNNKMKYVKPSRINNFDTVSRQNFNRAAIGVRPNFIVYRYLTTGQNFLQTGVNNFLRQMKISSNERPPRKILQSDCENLRPFTSMGDYEGGWDNILGRRGGCESPPMVRF